MQKTIVAVVLAGCAAVGGFAIGRGCAGGACVANAPRAAAAPSDGALDAAKKRIAALEAELAEARRDAERARKPAVGAEKAADGAIKEKDAVSSFSVGTNADILAELKKQLPEAEFAAATNALAGLRMKLAERAKGRIEYLSSMDVSRMTKAERDNHAKFLRLMERRETVAAKMKGGLPDAKTLEEMVALEIEMQPVAKAERSALVREVARELGYAGEDVETLHDTLDAVFDCTGSGGLGGLGDLNGLMDGAEIQPGVSVETHVIGL